MKKMDKWIILALFLMFLGNIGGILIIIFQTKSSSRNKDQIIQTTNANNEYLKEQLEKITKEREILKTDLEIRDKDNREKSEEIIQLNKDLLNKSEELNKFLGASDAYPILLVSSGSPENGISGFTFTISNEFDYPLYDVEVLVQDFSIILSNSKKENEKFILTREKFKESILFHKQNDQITARSKVINSKLFHLPNGILYVKLKCRNNFIFQKIAFVQIDNEIYHGFIVYDDAGETLKEWYGQNPTDEIKSKLQEKFNEIPKHVNMTFIN